MDECVFCSTPLSPGSEEHVFTASIGGRVVTRRATCKKCNNDFSSSKWGSIEIEFADELAPVRNLLAIWTGRGKPPPTIKNAGVMPEGGVFDLAPKAVPIIQAARIPPRQEFVEGTPKQMIARDNADVARIVDVLKKRKSSFELGDAITVTRKAPQTKFSITIGPNSTRAVAKIAIAACCVLFGNEYTRFGVKEELRASVKTGQPNIMDFAGLDYTNPWPHIREISPHYKTSDAMLSGFEHTAIICDVGPWWVCYIQLFGDIRFSVHLGPRSGLETKGISVNPRSDKPARFDVKAVPPNTYMPRTSETFKLEHPITRDGIRNALNKILQRWSEESRQSYSEQLAEDLVSSVSEVGGNKEAAIRIYAKFAEKVVTVETGGTWKEEFSFTQTDDEDPKPSHS